MCLISSQFKFRTAFQKEKDFKIKSTMLIEYDIERVYSLFSFHTAIERE